MKLTTNFFQRVCCVSLKRRDDRWRQFNKNLPSDWPFLKPERVIAIDGKLVKPPSWWRQGAPAWGCYRSHMRLIEQALNDGIDSILLMEDDAFCVKDFTQKVSEFIKHLPNDWGMLYLGGQHLYANKHPPQKINEHVYRPYNINRTHAFALRGKTMQLVYQHLCRTDWNHGHHIDHHLGRFHQQGTHPIYIPKEWLIGQAEGKSNISGKTPPDRLWQSAEAITTINIDEAPFVAVIGLHSSGSSCLAGVLYHLGLHLGNTLIGFWGNNPMKNCGFEAQGLADICEKAIPFPAVEYKWKPAKIQAKLKQWIANKKREATRKGTIAAGKYPLLCRMGKQLIAAGGKNLKIIHIDRPTEQSINSLIRHRTKLDPEKLSNHQRWLAEGKQEILENFPNHLTIHYKDLLNDPLTAIQSIINYLGITPSNEQIDAAARYVKPEMCNFS